MTNTSLPEIPGFTVSGSDALPIPLETSIVIAGYLTPPQVANSYKIPYATGHGVKIGIAAFGGGFYQSDLDKSFADLQKAGLIPAGLTAPTIKQVLLDGQTGSYSSNLSYSGETTLDIYCIATIVPEADITVYIGYYFDSIVNRALQDGCHFINFSYIIQEDSTAYASLTAASAELTLQTATANKLTMCAASGDYGSALIGPDKIYKLSAGCTASSPNVLSIGGTKLILNTKYIVAYGTFGVTKYGTTITSSVSGAFSQLKVGDKLFVYSGITTCVIVSSIETVTYQSITITQQFEGNTNSALPFSNIWTNDGTRYSETDDNRDINFTTGWGGGGGVSTLFSIPSFQYGKGLKYTFINNGVTQTPATLTMRGLPDISAPMNGVILWVNGGVGALGGTSAAAPMIIGMLARIQQLTGIQRSAPEYNTLFYNNPAEFLDITVGTNNTKVTSGYAGTVDWDPVTGLGPPDGVGLYKITRPASTYPKLNLGLRNKTTSARQWPRPTYAYNNRH